MIVQHSQTFVVELFETILKPKSQSELKNAESML